MTLKQINHLLILILDTAGQKGTGKWTSFNALEMGIPAPTIAEAVFARCLSAIKEERVYASQILKNEKNLNHKNFENQDKLIEAIHDALYCSKICSYAQGFQLMQEANKINNWNLNFAGIGRYLEVVVLFVQHFYRKFQTHLIMTII